MFIIQKSWFVYVKILVGGACYVHVYDKQCLLRPPPPLPKYKRLFIYSCIGGWPEGGSCICLFVSKFLFRCFWLVVV